jgi:hypothetical protein
MRATGRRKRQDSIARRPKPARFTHLSAATVPITLRVTGALETDSEGRRRRFKQTGHPFDPWQELASRAQGQPIPDWVLEYLDGAAPKIVAAIDLSKDPDRLAFAVAFALGFKSKGAGSVARRARVAATNDALAQRVLSQRRQGVKYRAAIADVAEKSGKGFTTVENAYRVARKRRPK